MTKALEYHRGVQNCIITADATVLEVVNSLARICKVINNSGLSKLSVCQRIADKADSSK